MFLPSSWEIFFLGDVLKTWVLSKRKLGGEQGVEYASKTRMGGKKRRGGGGQGAHSTEETLLVVRIARSFGGAS